MPGLIIRQMTDSDVPAAERLSDEGFYELDVRTQGPSSPAPERRDSGRSERWVARTLHFLEHRPRRLLGGRGRDGARRVRDQLRARHDLVPRDVRRPSGPAGTRNRSVAARRGAAARPRLPARDAVGLHGPQGPPPLPPGRVRAPPADAPRRPGRPVGDPGGGEGPRRVGGRHRPRRTRWTGRYAVPPTARTTSTCCATTGCWSSDSTTGSGYAFLGDREMVVVLLAATNRRTASRLLWAALADSPAGGAGHHPARHGGQRLGDRCRHGGSDGRCTMDGYLALRGMRPPAPYLHNGALL